MSSPQQKVRTNSQILGQLMQRWKFHNYTWTPHTFIDEKGRTWHKATFSYLGTPIATSVSRHPTAASAREEAAYYALPLVSAYLREGELPRSSSSGGGQREDSPDKGRVNLTMPVYGAVSPMNTGIVEGRQSDARAYTDAPLTKEMTTTFSRMTEAQDKRSSIWVPEALLLAEVSSEKAGLTRTRAPGPVGQFRVRPVKPLARYLIMLYLRAQSILQLARSVYVFHMQSIYISRQALHLVILLNDALDMENGPDEAQREERIKLEDDLIDLSEAMKEWGAAPEEGMSVDYSSRLPTIKHYYAQLFKERFYFHDTRILSEDLIFQRFFVYDERTIQFRNWRHNIEASSVDLETKGDSNLPDTTELPQRQIQHHHGSGILPPSVAHVDKNSTCLNPAYFISPHAGSEWEEDSVLSSIHTVNSDALNVGLQVASNDPNLRSIQELFQGNLAVGPSLPVTRERLPSSTLPKTPAAYADSYIRKPPRLTSDGESRKKRNFNSIFPRKQRRDSIVTSSSLSSGISVSGTSNAASAFSRSRHVLRSQKGPGTFGGLSGDEMLVGTQTGHGIRHSAADFPYPISFEEMVLQGEKHTQELLSTVLQQKAYHFTRMDNFSKLKNILDVGCGRGYWLSDAAKECENANLVGFDIVDVFLTPQELRDCRGLTDAQISHIKFRQGNFFDSLPFQDGEFDYIRLAFLELAIPEPKWVPLLKEAWRILKPGGDIEVVIESQLFPTVWSYDKLPVQQELEDEFRGMLEARDIPLATSIGEKMFFHALSRVQTHQHVSVCIAPRPAGHSSLDDPASPRNFGTARSMHSPWSSRPAMFSGMVSPVPLGRPSLDRLSVDVLPPQGHLVTSKTCTVPGIVIPPDTFIPVSEETLFAYASHAAMMLNAARLAAFSHKYPNASPEENEEEWKVHVERYWQYERSNRLRLGFRMKQFDDDDEDDEAHALGPTTGRWKWAKCDEDSERPLEIRRFRAWSLSKPLGSR